MAMKVGIRPDSVRGSRKGGPAGAVKQAPDRARPDESEAINPMDAFRKFEGTTRS